MEFEVPANLSDNERIRLEQLEMLVRERNLTVEDLIQNFTHFNNKDDDSIDPQEYLSGMFSLKIFFYLFYLLIFVLGLAGNALVCYVVIRNKSMHNVTNVFITNLALSDILLCIFAVPFTPLYLLTFKAWVFGKLFCHLVPYAQGVSVYISAFTLMAIAIDRFFVIIHPFKPRMAMYTCGLIIVTIWIVSCILTLPYGLFVELIPFDEEVLFCDEKWPFEESRRAFSLTTSVLQFVIPFIIISYCYYRVCAKLSDRARSMPGAKSLQKEEQERERTKRTNRMLISMVIIFGISWLPLNCHNLIQDFYMPAASWRYSAAFFLLAHAVAMSSCCYNPFLYAWLNENFRKEFKLVLPCFDSVRLTSMGSERKTAREDKFKPNGFPKVESTTNAQESRLPQEYIPLEGLNTPSTQTTPLHQTPKH